MMNPTPYIIAAATGTKFWKKATSVVSYVNIKFTLKICVMLPAAAITNISVV